MRSEPSKRSQKVADLIQRETALALKREINDPRLVGVSITSVSVSPDLKNARIFYTLLDDSQVEEVSKALEKGAGFIRHCIAERVALRYMPRLTFVFDKTLESAERMTRILQDIKTPDKQDEEDSSSE